MVELVVLLRQIMVLVEVVVQVLLVLLEHLPLEEMVVMVQLHQ